MSRAYPDMGMVTRKRATAPAMKPVHHAPTHLGLLESMPNLGGKTYMYTVL